MNRRMYEIEIYVKRDDCEVTKILANHSLGAELSNLNTGTKSSSHLLEFDVVHKDFLNMFKEKGMKLRQVGRGKVIVESPSCTSCKILADLNSVILYAKSRGENIVIYGLLSDEPSFKMLEKEFKNKGVEYGLIKKEEYKSLPNLTLKQTQLVLFAFINGYFDTKRRITLSSIAEKFGIKPSTADLIMRRALKKIVEKHVMKKI
ncbi:MAG: helix-turn-helix domain-containing protein [Thermoplasmatales archaeon]